MKTWKESMIDYHLEECKEDDVEPCPKCDSGHLKEYSHQLLKCSNSNCRYTTVACYPY